MSYVYGSYPNNAWYMAMSQQCVCSLQQPLGLHLLPSLLHRSLLRRSHRGRHEAAQPFDLGPKKILTLTLTPWVEAVMQ